MIRLVNGEQLHADTICVATGGMLKADKLTWLQKLGHEIVAPVPSLFTFICL